MARRGMRASAPQAVTFVELFFDLVFVFAVTQVTVLTAYDLTGAGVLRAVLIFWMIWWAWTQFTWTLNPADTTHTFVRAITLLATAVAFVMATAVPDAFGDGALWSLSRTWWSEPWACGCRYAWTSSAWAWTGPGSSGGWCCRFPV